ncbi:sodium:calcium antiporter [Natrinema versiforme]|uniref:Sodium/calcium exchanger membrane region n=1 Tax=Natrinema versiforme JCM 10478 TaxID=1227496 RepID=L9Y101_9EURY|nr:sodium/calcium exchanger membrane region [Natrinema versiforme]ELY66518.1 sodium/calcium exchanger membrane region [Natrinema versiforme JCM 10478]
MIEAAVESVVEAQGLWAAYLVLAIGAIVLTYSVEKLISYLTRAALGLGVSIFALAIVFTGIEFDDTVVALVFGAGELEQVALGTALGTALAITGITLAVAAIYSPFPVEVPRDYLLLLAIAPLLLIPFVIVETLTLGHGLVLTGVFVALFGYIVLREIQRDVPVFRDSEIAERIEADGGVPIDELAIEDVDSRTVLEDIPEDRYVAERRYEGVFWLGFAGVALVGVMAGALLLETGSEAIIESWGIEETVFGATVLTLVLTVENLLLTIEPVRRGIPEIGIGHVIGSVIFSVTANVGVITYVADVTIPREVLFFHLPAVAILTAVAAVVISTGRIRRRHGYVLVGLYVAYWLCSLLFFGGIPIPEAL